MTFPRHLSFYLQPAKHFRYKGDALDAGFAISVGPAVNK